MKSPLIIIFVFYFCFCGKLAAQDSALSMEASYMGDIVRNFSGGIKKGSSYLGLANFKISFDTENARLWKGGLFFVNAANAHGGNPSASLIGDFHTVSNIEADELTYIHELWFRQTFNKLEITGGLQDLNTDFVSSEYGSIFLNSTFGTPSTIADNIPSPIFPLTAVGVSLKWRFAPEHSFKIAAFDGLPTDFERNPYNLKWDVNTNEGIMAVSEYQYSGSDKKGLKNSYRFGIYYHSQLIENDEYKKHYYNHGLYVIADQMLYREHGENGGLGIFAQAAISPKAINTHNIYAGMGLSYQGLFNRRDEDKLGVAFTYAGFNQDSKQAETIIEISYRAQLTENLFIQPDLQYVINPEGTDLELENATVGFLRFGLNF